MAARHPVALATLICALVCIPLFARANDEPDEEMPGTSLTVRTGRRVTVVGRAAVPYDPPDPANDPRVEGATLQVFDTGGSAGGDSYDLPAAGWNGLGVPPGSAGFRYRGSAADPCRSAVVKRNVVRATCRGAAITLAPPFAGDAGVILIVGTDSKRYCATFGGTTGKNTTGVLRRRNAPAGPCPSPPGPSTSTTSTTSTTSSTVAASCCGAERITLTSSVGTLQIDNISPSFTFPAGIVTVLDSGPALTGQPECRHDVLVPAGGFTIPNFEVPGVNYCAALTTTGCASGGADGKGALWDGGGNAGLAITNVTKEADTADGVCDTTTIVAGTCSGGPNNGNPCAVHPDCQGGTCVGGSGCTTLGAGANTLGQLVTTRTASASAGLRAAVDIPGQIFVWADATCSPAQTPGCCASATYDPPADIEVFTVDFILSPTTDVATGAFVDMNGNLCRRAGAGFDTLMPNGPRSQTGSPLAGPCCTPGQGATLAAVGVLFSGTAPFYDVGFRITSPVSVTSCGAPAAGSCVLTTDPCLGSPSEAFLEPPG